MNKKIIGVLTLDDLTKEVELSQEFYEKYRILNEFAEMCIIGEGLTDEEKKKGDFDNELDNQYENYYGGKYMDSLIDIFEDAFNIELYNFSDDISYDEENENEIRIYLNIKTYGNNEIIDIKDLK